MCHLSDFQNNVSHHQLLLVIYLKCDNQLCDFNLQLLYPVDSRMFKKFVMKQLILIVAKLLR